LAAAPAPISLAYVEELLRLRQEARRAGIPAHVAEQIDAEVERAVVPSALRAKNAGEVQTQLRALLALFDVARQAGAPQNAFDAVTTAYDQTLALGLPAPDPADGRLRLIELLAMREDLRERRFPA